MYLVIDGLSRSGTTLLSSLLHSQSGVACYRGLCHEPLACNFGDWPNEYLDMPALPADTPIQFKDDPPPGLGPDGLCLSPQALKEVSLSVLEQENQFGTLNRTLWAALFDRPITSLDDLDAMYAEIAALHQAKVLGFRWNQGISYTRVWASRPSHKWVAVIRNPMDRASSVRKLWSYNYKQLVRDAVRFADILEAVKSSISHIVYYEDLISDPDGELRKLFAAIGYTPASIDTVNLKHQDGTAYRSESAMLMDEDGTHKKGRVFDGFYKSRVDIYKTELPAEVTQAFQAALVDRPLYARYF